MANFPWLPLGYPTKDGTVGRLKHEGSGYQVVLTEKSDAVLLFLANDSLARAGVHRLTDNDQNGFQLIQYGGQSFLSRSFESAKAPLPLREWSTVMGLPTSSDAAAVGKAVRRLRQRFPRVDVGDALFIPSLDECLPVSEHERPQDLRNLAAKFLAGGAQIPLLDVASIRGVNSWLTPVEIETFLAALGLEAQTPVSTSAPDPMSFTLPGRPDLERFFREYILEPSLDRDRYDALRVKTPNGILLYGPPGSGKTHAVGKLVSALGWPKFEIDLGKLGSPFIHQTSVALRRTFDEAERSAPAVILLEEVDALAGSRNPAMLDHKIEEVAELLRLVETASDKNVLVIATTNRREAVDPAILRKGRFDHSIEVDYPTAEEVAAALEAMLAERPHQAIGDLGVLAQKLSGRPMSDVAWVVNEAARLAARGKKDAIDEIDLFSAIKRLKA